MKRTIVIAVSVLILAVIWFYLDGKPRDFIQIADPPDRIKRHEYYKALPHQMKSEAFIAEAYKPDKNKPMTFRVERLEK